MNVIAKAIFLKYDGNFSLMANDGVYDEYKLFNVPKEDELKWLKELEMIRFAKLAVSNDVKTDFVKLCLSIKKTKNVDLFRALFEFLYSEKINSLNELSRLYVVETYMDTMRSFKKLTSINEYISPISSLLNSIKLQSGDKETKERADCILADLSII